MEATVKVFYNIYCACEKENKNSIGFFQGGQEEKLKARVKLLEDGWDEKHLPIRVVKTTRVEMSEEVKL